MPTPPPIKTSTPLDQAEDVPQRILGGDLAPTSPGAVVDTGLRASPFMLAGAAFARYALGFVIHGRGRWGLGGAHSRLSDSDSTRGALTTAIAWAMTPRLRSVIELQSKIG